MAESHDTRLYSCDGRTHGRKGGKGLCCVFPLCFAHCVMCRLSCASDTSVCYIAVSFHLVSLLAPLFFVSYTFVSYTFVSYTFVLYTFVSYSFV